MAPILPKPGHHLTSTSVGSCFYFSWPHCLNSGQLHLSLAPSLTELLLFLPCCFPTFCRGQEKQCWSPGERQRQSRACVPVDGGDRGTEQCTPIAMLMASEKHNKIPALSWLLLGCGRQGRDLSASHSPTSLAGLPSRSAPVMGALTGAFPVEITDNLAASTWVGVDGKKPRWSPGLSYQELPGLLAPVIAPAARSMHSPLGVWLNHHVRLIPTPS